MKKHLMALSAFAMMAVAANAQTTPNENGAADQHNATHLHHKRSGYGMHRHHGNDMMMNLNLAAAQKEQAKALHNDYRNRLKDLEKNEAITLKDYRAKKADLEQERKSKFQDILTAEQKNKIVQSKKEGSEKRAAMANKRLEKMKTDLNLTNEQVAKIKEQGDNSMAQAKAIRENSSLTQEQKKAQFRKLMENRKESMNSILSAEQLQKKEALRNSRINDMKNRRSNKES
ncbi:MAG: hypothetical protein ABI416_08385 [Ginsengibacter sp.]